jgi:hypothetical protein
MGKKLHGYAGLREFIERLPAECAHFATTTNKYGYEVSTPEGCPLNVLHMVGAPDPLGLEPGKSYDLRYAGNAGGPQSRIFEEYQLRPGHKIIRKKDEDGKEREIGWEHTFDSIWFFKAIPGSGKRKKTFYVTAPYRVLGLSAIQPASIVAPKPTPAKLVPKKSKVPTAAAAVATAVSKLKPKSLTSQADPALALKRHNAAVKANETRRRLLAQNG